MKQTENERLFEVAFVLIQENAFLRGFILKPIERTQFLLKNSTRDFQSSPPFQRSTCFYVTITGDFERFQYFNFETNFLKNENLFQKIGQRFLAEVTEIENATFPYNTTLSKANVKTNRMVSAKWTYHKKQFCH